MKRRRNSSAAALGLPGGPPPSTPAGEIRSGSTPWPATFAGRAAVAGWSAERKLEFCEDWHGGLSYENLATRYLLAGDLFQPVRGVVGALGLKDRGRIAPSVAAAAAAGDRFKRNCLTCGRPFMSEGSHNRVCGPCKKTADWRGGGDFAMGARLAET